MKKEPDFLSIVLRLLWAVLLFEILVVGCFQLTIYFDDIRNKSEIIEFDESTVKPAEQPNAVEEVLKPNPKTVMPLKHLGNFKITAYCACSKCCGKSDGITASGVKATAGRTIAVDTNIIPFGTKVIIDGYEYVAEDRGGSIIGNRIDIFMESHAEAINFGVQYKEVFAG